MGFPQRMKEEWGYTFRERMNVYAGAALGLITPIAATRYIAFPSSFSGEYAAIKEVGAWVGSAVMNVAATAGLKGFPLAYTGVHGFALGVRSASNLQAERHEEAKELERILAEDSSQAVAA